MPPRPKFAAAINAAADDKHLKHKRRYCRAEGCNRIVKSQGLCQRHGAKPRKCKVEGCEKQAQGNFDRMCKSHFKAMKRATTPLPKVLNLDMPPPAQGSSVYDSILPKSISYLPTSPSTTMPLITHLKHGFDILKPPAWHRNEERRARGLFPIDNAATQLEGWERELVWMEILVLTGAPNASFRHLARAWGRDKGFHMVLAQFICERHGDVQRKKRQGENLANGGRRQPPPQQQQPPPKKRKLMHGKIGGIGGIGSIGGIGGIGKKQGTAPGVISADVWDDSAYGDADMNEALAADIFNFSAQEFEQVSFKWKLAYVDSEATSSPSQSSFASKAAMTAILGDESTKQPRLPTGLLVPNPPAPAAAPSTTVVEATTTTAPVAAAQHPTTTAAAAAAASSVAVVGHPPVVVGQTASVVAAAHPSGVTQTPPPSQDHLITNPPQQHPLEQQQQLQPPPQYPHPHYQEAHQTLEQMQEHQNHLEAEALTHLRHPGMPSPPR